MIALLVVAVLLCGLIYAGYCFFKTLENLFDFKDIDDDDIENDKYC